MKKIFIALTVILSMISATAALADYDRHPANRLTTDTDISALEYSSSGTVWTELPFVKYNGTYFFNRIDERFLRIKDGAILSGEYYNTSRTDIDISSLESEVTTLLNTLSAEGITNLGTDLEAKLATLKAKNADMSYTGYDVVSVRKEITDEIASINATISTDDYKFSLAKTALSTYLANNYMASSDTTIASYMNNMNTAVSSSSDSLWSGVTDLTAIYTRINNMAKTYVNSSSAYYHNATLLSDIQYALNIMDTYFYNSNTTMVNNWWTYIIGVPQQYTEALINIWDTLDQNAQTRYAASLQNFSVYNSWNGVTAQTSTQEGANLVEIASFDYRMGVLTKDITKTKAALAKLDGVFTYADDASSTSTDGFYSDGSFLQHGVPYNGNYGKEFLSAMVGMSESLAHTSWSFSDAHINTMCEWIDKGFLPLMYNSNIMDMVNGRAIVRNYTDKTYGWQVGRAIIHFAYGLNDTSKQTAYYETIKYLFTNGGNAGTSTWSSGSDALVKSIVNSSSVSAVDHTKLATYAYNSMDRISHRPSSAWAMGIAMYSSRVQAYELTNGENKQGWYTGAGATYLYNGDKTQYTNSYWLTADMYSIPGTTVDSTQRTYDSEQYGDGETTSSKSFVGGLGVGTTGVAVMDLAQVSATSSTLQGYKSYFMFDDGVVCMGTTIRGGNGEIYTTVANEKADSSPLVAADGTSVSLSSTEQSVTGSAFLTTVNSQTTGYYFSTSTAVNIKYESRSVTASDRSSSFTGTYSGNFLTMKLDHGSGLVYSTAAKYCYMILPNKTQSEMTSFAADPTITIKNQSNGVHAVYSSTSGATGMVFFNKATAYANGCTVISDSKCVAELTDSGTLAVCDTTRSLTSVTLTINKAMTFSETTGATVSVSGSTTTVTFDFSAKDGKAITIK